MLVVFVGITGAFQLSVDVVTNNKARAGAIALANERQEYLRSLPYDSVGTVGGIPPGTVPQTESTELNGITYTRRTVVLWGDDPKDGAGAGDQNGVITDFKEAKTEVSWIARSGGVRKVSLVTRVSPVGVEQLVPGGTLSLLVVNASAQPVSSAGVAIVNASVAPPINLTLYTDSSGMVSVIGVPAGAGYAITVGKSGYSTDQTYSVTAENTNPAPGHLTVALNQTTSAAFAIDVLGSKTVRSFLPIQNGAWDDLFDSEAKIAATTSVEVAGGSVVLAGGVGSYEPSGEVQSVGIAPAYLAEWKTLSWTKTEPADTTLAVQVYDGGGATLISDAQIAGNSTGLTASPVSLTGVSTSTHVGLVLKAQLTSGDPNRTPSLDSWQIDFDSGPTALANLAFSMRGSKTIGSGPGGTVYKYNQIALTTGPSGSITLDTMEWDPAYAISVDGAATNYDVASSCNPQPESLTPGSGQTTFLYLAPHTTNSLLVDVRGTGGALIPNATVRLYRGAYDTAIVTDSCGQSFFSGLSVGTPGGGNPYSIDVSAAGYTNYTAADVSVSGTSRLSVILN